MERRICKSRILAVCNYAGALSQCISAGFAAPSQSGKSGLLLAPSADTLGQGSLAIGYSRLGLTDCVYINAGVIPNLEVGLGSRGFGFGAEVYPMLKFRLMGETADLPAVAVGLEGQALYLAASKRLLSSGQGLI